MQKENSTQAETMPVATVHDGDISAELQIAIKHLIYRLREVGPVKVTKIIQ